MAGKFLIFDGNSILNRAFYGIRFLSTKDGFPTNAIYGFLSIISKHIDTLAPDYVACAFDLPGKTFRHQFYSEYKGTRKGMPDDLAKQLPYAKEFVKSLGITVLECQGYEADDVIGTAVARAEEENIKSYIVTGDRDSLQLITQDTYVVLSTKNGDIIYDEQRFYDEKSVTPTEYIDVKALMGDSSDNIPGVRGIGEKSAFALIAEAKSLDNLYSDLEKYCKSKSVFTKLTEDKESAYMSKYLATIVKDAPIPPSDEIFKSYSINTDEFLSLCEKFELRDMSKRFVKEGIKSTFSPSKDQPEFSSRKVPCGEIAKLPADVTYSVFLKAGGINICGPDNEVLICDDISKEDLRSFISKRKIVCHDLKSLLKDTDADENTVDCAFDTMIASYLLDPGKRDYSLALISKKYLSCDEMTPDCESFYIRELYSAMRDDIEKLNMNSLIYDIEIPLSKLLYRMEKTGFKIDPEGIRNYSKELEMMENRLVEDIHTQSGYIFNVNSPKQLGEILFEKMGLPNPKGGKNKTGYSTDAETLESIRFFHPIVDEILDYRQVSKLRSTYGENLANQADPFDRIHTNLSQTGTATGRLASSEPNLQNIPVREELGRNLRKFFIADRNKVLVDADYSQIELRILAAMAEDENMKNAFKDNIDIHTHVASQVFDIPVSMVTPELRRRAKAVNFGIVYGIGPFSLAKDLGITNKQAKEYIENYLYTYSGVDSFLKKTVEFAKKNGYTETLFGRRRYLPEIMSPKATLRAFGERMAKNSPIQGTAADVIKIAMLKVAEALKNEEIDARLIMQVHDELIVEAAEDCVDKAKEILKREMENAVTLSVPLIVECGVGKNWLDAK